MSEDKVLVQLQVKIDDKVKYVTQGRFGKDEPPLLELPDNDTMVKFINAQLS